MDHNHIQEFLASGQLELYLHGNLSEDEVAQVEDYIARYPEVRSYFNELENKLEDRALNDAIEPPSGVKAKIMESIEPKKSTQSTHFYRHTQYLLAASFLLGITTILGTALYAMQYFNHQRTVTTLQTELINCRQDQEKILALEQQIAFYSDPNTQIVNFDGNTLLPGFSALAQVNKEAATAYLQLTQIPRLPENKVVQVWGDIDGRMIPVAIIADLSTERMQYGIDPEMESLNFTLEDITPDGKGQDHPDVTMLFASAAI